MQLSLYMASSLKSNVARHKLLLTDNEAYIMNIENEKDKHKQTQTVRNTNADNERH